MRDDAPSHGTAGRFGHALTKLVDVFAYLGIAGLAVAVALTCADILWRRIVGGAFVDIVDITSLCLVAAASWSIPYAFLHGQHVTVEILADRLPGRLRLVLAMLAAFLAAALLALLLGLGMGSALQAFRYGDASLNLAIPMLVYWAIFLSGLALTLAANLWIGARGGLGAPPSRSEPL
ncbi:TRAP transporter small permease [Afifella pfennigii]|uniref:TRAP transporter small permease n=1 Tax=Afifella pfennigii TaxID=209897 RepID=UPI00068C38C2|nr:TRAP transporter small permease [Afifella pfennigii]